MKRSIRREIAWRRFSKARNASSREVWIAGKCRHMLPARVRKALPPVIERVFHPIYGWGILETFYANADGTAVIPYEYELRRQTSPENKRIIYTQARDLLLELIDAAAFFYEPGNFHTLIRPDGGIETKLIDFEPEAKTFIPLETVSATFRRWKLRRKAKRYLASMRERYGIDVIPTTSIG